MESIYFCAMLC